MNKLGSLLRSRRFWVAVIGVVAVAAHETLGIDQDQVTSVGMIVVAWILGDSLQKTGVAEHRSRGMIVVALLCSAASSAFAQGINIPERVDPHSKLVASIESSAPEDAETKLSWSVPAGVEFERVGDRLFLWAPPGEHELAASLIWVQFELIEIEVNGEPRQIKNLIDFGQDQHAATFTVGEPEPEPDPEPGPGPDPGPDPDVPPDDFQNIGERVAKWARGLDGRLAAAAIYREAAEKLRTDPAWTVDDAGEFVVGRLKKAIDYETWSSLRANINADLQERWPMSRGVLADYNDAIATGLEAGQR